MKIFTNKAIFIVFISCLLVGCITNIIKAKTVLELSLAINKLPDDYQGIVIFENTPELKRIFKENTKYITWGIRSDSINANSLPKELKIKYATININPDIYYKSLSAEKDRLRNNHAQSLPPSAWRTYTIYPKQLLEQGRAMPANGEPAKNWAHGTKVTITLYIDGNGNISQTIEHEPIRKNKWTT